MLIGKVIWFDKISGKGAARCSTGYLANFDMADVADETRQFYPGQKVFVEITSTPMSPIFRISLAPDDEGDCEHRWDWSIWGRAVCDDCGQEEVNE